MNRKAYVPCLAAILATSTVASRAYAEPSFVAIFADDAPLAEALRSELGLKGYRVSTFGVPQTGCFGTDMPRVAAEADAAVCVSGAQEHVFARKQGALAHTDTVALDAMPAVAAVRGAEITRMRLLTAPPYDPPAPAPAPTASEPAPVAPVVTAATEGVTSELIAPGSTLAPPSRDRDAVAGSVSDRGGFALGVGLGAFANDSSRVPAVTALVVSADYRFSMSRFSLHAATALLSSSAAGPVHEEIGPRGVWHVMGGGRWAVAETERVGLHLGGGFGFMSGKSPQPFENIKPWTFVYGEARGEVAISEHTRLSLESGPELLLNQSAGGWSYALYGMAKGEYRF